MTTFSHTLSLFAIGVLGASLSVLGQQPDGKKTTETVLNIELQNPPNSFEPTAEPTRVRVDDRSSVRIHLSNLSPIDLCTLGNRTPTPTVETNPLESLVTSIATLGGFNFAGDAQALSRGMVEAESRKATTPFDNDPRFVNFWKDANGFRSMGEMIVGNQMKLQGDLDKAMRKVAIYGGGDYRGTSWRDFDPEHDTKMKDPRDLVQIRIATVEDAANQQGILDEMAGYAADLAKGVGTPPTPLPVPTLSAMNTAIGQAKGLMAIISDNNTALKAAQASLKTAFVALVKVHDDFIRRKDQRFVSVVAGDVLAQDFVLGTDRKATITGTVTQALISRSFSQARRWQLIG